MKNTNTQLLLIAGIILFAAGCTDLAGETDEQLVDDGVSCAKCDVAIEASEWGRCWVADSSLTCDLTSEGVLIPSVMTVEGYDQDGNQLGAGVLRTAGSQELFEVPDGSFPVSLQVGFALPSDNPVTAVSATSFEVSAELSDAGAEPLTFIQPFDLWQVTVAGEGFNIFHFQGDEEELDIAPFQSRSSSGGETTITVRRTFTVNAGTIETLYWPAGSDGPISGSALVTTPDGGMIEDMPITFEGPGHYIIGAGGVAPVTEAEFAAATESFGTGDDDPDTDDPDTDDPDTDDPDTDDPDTDDPDTDDPDTDDPDTDDPDTDDPDTDPEPETDPCEGACYDGEVCAGETCRRRSNQTSGSVCDDDDDLDCADNYVCAAGSCQRRSSQTSGSDCDNDSNDDCADGYVCAAGSCQRRSSQTSGSDCDNDSNDDCADGYVCAAASCQRRSSQTSGSDCDDDSNADCADGYVCAAASCQRRSSQTSGSDCDDDSDLDCADNYVCAAGSCQNRSNQTSGSDCEDATDCADGYTCGDDQECARN